MILRTSLWGVAPFYSSTKAKLVCIHQTNSEETLWRSLVWDACLITSVFFHFIIWCKFNEFFRELFQLGSVIFSQSKLQLVEADCFLIMLPFFFFFLPYNNYWLEAKLINLQSQIWEVPQQRRSLCLLWLRHVWMTSGCFYTHPTAFCCACLG